MSARSFASTLSLSLLGGNRFASRNLTDCVAVAKAVNVKRWQEQAAAAQD